MKKIGFVIVIICCILVTFFGLGPVIFADGSKNERLVTFLIVVIIYIILVICFILLRRSNKK